MGFTLVAFPSISGSKLASTSLKKNRLVSQSPPYVMAKLLVVGTRKVNDVLAVVAACAIGTSTRMLKTSKAVICLFMSGLFGGPI